MLKLNYSRCFEREWVMYRILVVDDEPMIRMGLAKLITQTDPAMIQAETAGNGMEALKRSRRHGRTSFYGYQDAQDGRSGAKQAII